MKLWPSFVTLFVILLIIYIVNMVSEHGLTRLNLLLFPLLGSQMFGNVFPRFCLHCQKKRCASFVCFCLLGSVSDSIRAMSLSWLLCAFVAPFIVCCWSSLVLYKCHNMVFFGALIQQMVLFKDMMKNLLYCSNWS